MDSFGSGYGQESGCCKQDNVPRSLENVLSFLETMQILASE
jgi:hypothetical protein